MDQGFENEIRARAYAVWMASGMIEGAAEDHWFEAERMLRNEAAALSLQVHTPVVVRATKPTTIASKPVRAAAASKVAGKAETAMRSAKLAKPGGVPRAVVKSRRSTAPSAGTIEAAV